MTELGGRLRAARKRKGWTQAYVADRLGVHRTAYTKYETDVAEPSLSALREIARLLDVSIDDLLA